MIERIIERPRFDEKAHELADDSEAAVDPLLLVRVGSGVEGTRQWRMAPVFAFHPASLAVAPPAGHPELWYDHPSARRGGVGQGLVAQILVTPDGGWALVRTSRTHGRQAGVRCPSGQTRWEGAIVGGTGMPMELRLDVQVVANAEPAPVPRSMLPDQRDRAARWIELEIERGAARGRQWIRRDGGDGSGIAAVTLDDGSPVLVRYTRAQYDLGQRHGFRIKLERFDEGKDIGPLPAWFPRSARKEG